MTRSVKIKNGDAEPAQICEPKRDVIDCLAEALRRHQCGLIRPLWADMSEKMQAPWREYAEKLLPIREVEDGK